jgi:hypothetical protein
MKRKISTGIKQGTMFLFFIYDDKQKENTGQKKRRNNLLGFKMVECLLGWKND